MLESIFSPTLRKKPPTGFTLIELMVVIAIAAILMGVGVPYLQDAMLGSKLRSHATELISTLNQARSEALKRNSPVTLCTSTDGSNCESGGWERGWILLSGTTVIRRQTEIENGFHISGTISSIDFQPSGLASTSATFTVCRATPEPGRQEHVITLRPTGRISTEITGNAICP